MGRRARRTGWKPNGEPYQEPGALEPQHNLPPAEIPLPTRYVARADPLFPGTWRAEPQNYRGRGVVYLFHGDRARLRAVEWAEKKSWELDLDHGKSRLTG
jgi:hypothetical protein